MLINTISREQQYLIVEKHEIEAKLKKLPKGKLLCTKNGKYIKWFKSNGKNPIYIPKKNHKLAENLALRQYYQMQLDNINQQLHFINNYISAYEQEKIKYTSSSNPIITLAENTIRTSSNEINEWLESDYIQNNNYKENLKHKTLSGYIVRSKSEVLIANALYQNNIPFKYECQLTINDISYYPDFTILHPRTKSILYWEHFGLMDKCSYAENAYNKLKSYANANIIPTINLILTFETNEYPIDSENIQELIEHYLL